MRDTYPFVVGQDREYEVVKNAVGVGATICERRPADQRVNAGFQMLADLPGAP